MESTKQSLYTRSVMLAFAVFLALPALAFAGQGRVNPSDVYAVQRDGRDYRTGDGQRDDNDRNRRHGDRSYHRRGRDWDGYGNYGGSNQLRQTALNAGYNEGYKVGRKDDDKNRRFDFQDEKEYQKATKDYSSRLGDREVYRRYFREAFETGYRDGYNGY